MSFLKILKEMNFKNKHWNTSGILLIIIVLTSLPGCRSTKPLLREDARLDTLYLNMNMKQVQPYEYQMALNKRLEKLIQVYNTEEHPFKLAIGHGNTPHTCSIDFLRVKFVSRKQSHIAAAFTATGIATASALLLLKFFIPVGWLYIPNAKTTIEPHFTTDLTPIRNFHKVTLASLGMYRKQQKQIDQQSLKVGQYILAIVQNIEEAYKKELNTKVKVSR